MRERLEFWKGQFVSTRGSLLSRYPSLVKIAANTGWLAVDKLVRMGVGVGISAWMARYLGPNNFGTLNYATAMVALLGAVASLGLDNIVKREIVRFPGRAPQLLATSFIAKLFAGSGCYLLLICLLKILFVDHRTFVVSLIIGWSLIVTPLLTGDLWLQAHLLSKYTVWAQNGAFILFSAVRVILIVRQQSLFALALTIPLEALVGGVLVSSVYLRLTGYSRLQFDLKVARELLTQSWPLLFASLVVMIYMRIDQLMLGGILGNQAVGIYSAALRVSEIWYFIPVVLASSLFPTIVRRKYLNVVAYSETIQNYFDLNAALAYALAIPAAILAPSVIRLLYGHEYTGAESILVVHVWAAVFVFLGVAREQFFVAEGLIKFSFYTTIVGAVCNIAMNFWLIPLMGGLGAAIATVISQASAVYLSAFFYRESRPAAIYMSKSLLFPARVLSRVLRHKYT